MTILLEIILKGFVVLAAGSLIALAFRRGAAATRHLVWAVTMATVAGLPVLALVTPDVEVRVPVAAVAHVPAAQAPASTPLSPPAPVWRSSSPDDTDDRGAATAEMVPASPPPVRGFEAARPRGDAGASIASLVVAFWAGGASLVLAVLVGERLRLRSMLRRARPVEAGPAHDTLARVCREAGLGRPPRLFAGADDLMPMTWGVLRAAVLLPEAAVDWPESRREAVLRHEIAHVRRHDDAVQVLATVGAALHWCNPVAWFALHRLRVEREFACDDEVLRHGSQPSAYAAELLHIAARCRPARRAGFVAQAMARSSHLRERVVAVLEESRRRWTLTAVRGLTAGLAALMLAVPLAGVQIAGVAAVTGPDANGPSRTVTPRGADAPRDAAVQAPTACWQPGQSNSSSISSTDDDEWRHVWRSRSCEAEIVLRGQLEFDDVFERITGISTGGRFRLMVDEGGTERQLDVTRAGGDAATFTWRVDGREAPFDDAARAWVSGLLPVIFRATGLAAEARAASIYARQGADGVLGEVGQMRSNSVRGRYLTALFAQPNLGDDAIVRALGETARIDSNSTMTRVLSDFDERHGARLGDGRVGTAFWQAAGAIDSNSNLRRLLTDIVAGEPASSPLVGRVIDEAAARIDSSSTLASLLRDLRRAYPGIASSGPHAGRYWTAVSRIDSSSTVRGLLSDLADGEPLDSALLPLVFDAAADRITSSSDLAEFLTAMARRDPAIATSGPVVDRFWMLAGRIRSNSTTSQFLLDVTRGRGEGDAALDRALDAARAGISSSSTMGEFLVAFAGQHRGAAAGRLESTILAAANAISSRSTRERTLERLAAMGVG